MTDDGEIPVMSSGDQHGHNYYGTFQGVANYYYAPQQRQQLPAANVDPVIIGFPLPVPPPGSSVVPPPYNPFSYQAPPGYVGVHQGYPVVDVLRVGERRLPCLGIGWFLFFIGFFLGGIPWYIGAFLLLCSRLNPREKPGYIACAIASFLSIFAIALSARQRHHHWWL
ncbi:hypothetical protein MLD38_027618 [Melastoma candidum]|uniref:Uncharacterized protein n=1 Tax=Melastoma candidum TaxID=119954 RepID=A0ACB9P2T6_9MYRT|nr:hypothetical protein MLD38_027618 [Melastoma candidum]